MRGWTADPDTAGPIQAHVYVDGVGACGPDREPVTGPTSAALTRGLGHNHGFDADDPGHPAPHIVCAYGISVGNGGNKQLGCRVYVTGNTSASLDSATRRPGSVVLRGWAIDPDTINSVPIHVYVDGVGAAVGTRQRRREDVGTLHTPATVTRTASS